jgi:hypothetical protein
MGNTIGLPATPRGNSLPIHFVFTMYGGTQPMDLTGMTLAFIANRSMDQKITPPVYIQWTNHTDPPNGITDMEIPDSLTATLDPGDYYFNVTGQDSTGTVKTYLAGTWPITPVPGLISGAP